MSKPRLISFKVCPFAQRSSLLLKEKQIDFELAFINPDEPPAWFVELSPTGKVPVLEVDGTAIFESSVISEYLDERYPPSIHPSDLLTKATNRAWVEHTSNIYTSIFQIIIAKDKTAFKSAQASIDEQLDLLDEVMLETPWFNGADFSMLDIAAAPIAVRLDILKEVCGLDLLEEYPKLSAWFERLLARETVQASYPPELKMMLTMRLKGNKSYIYTSETF